MSKTITITLSDEQIAQIAAIRSTRLDRTVDEIINQVIERGIYTLAYRTKYNAMQAPRKAAERKEFTAWRAMNK